MTNSPELNKQVSDCCGADMKVPRTPENFANHHRCRSCGKPCTSMPAPTHQQEAAGKVSDRDLGKCVLLSNGEIALIIKALAYYREENGGDKELENDLKMVIRGTL